MVLKMKALSYNVREGFFMRKFGSFVIIFLLLPCVITVLVKGGDVLKWNKNSEEYVKIEDGVTLRWEEYFIGLLVANISEDCEPEMLKAQAVVLRTQEAAKMQAGEKLNSAYLTMDDLKEKWDAKDFKKYMKKYERAIRATKREVLMYEEQIANVPFCKLSNGMTRDAAQVLGADDEGNSRYPYLVSVDCSADKEADGEMEIQTFSYEEVQKKCQPFLVAVEPTVTTGTDPVDTDAAGGTDPVVAYSDFEIVSTDSAGYVLEIKILGNVYSGEQFRQALNLPSSAFAMQDYKGKLRITTMGQGHGLGMSQYTANEMAKGGATYQKILEYFYNGTNLQKNDEIFLKLE